MARKLSKTRGRKKKFSVRIIYGEYGFFSNAHAPHFRSNVECSQRNLMISHSALETTEKNKKMDDFGVSKHYVFSQVYLYTI